jgi:hypothetical protein
MNSLIPTITNEELNMLSDPFWLKLGTEHCNIKTKIFNIIDLLQNNFPNSNPIMNLFGRFHNLYFSLSCDLDNVVCAHYPLDGGAIIVPPSFDFDFNHEHNTADERRIVKLFYSNDTVKKYPVTKYKMEGKKRYSGYISPKDMQYINDFITQQDNYFEYLRHICTKITENSGYSKKRFRTKILKSIQHIEKYRKCYEDIVSRHVRVEENYEKYDYVTKLPKRVQIALQNSALRNNIVE